MSKKGENIYKRKDGRWEGRIKFFDVINGKSKYKSVYGSSYSEVKQKLIVLKSNVNNITISGNVYVKELFEEWLLDIKTHFKETTYANYKMKVQKHLIPFFGDYKYDRICLNHIHQFIDIKLKSGLSAKYINDLLFVFKSMCKFVSRIYGYRNPLEHVEPLRFNKKEVKLLDTSEQKELIKIITSQMDRSNLGILLSYYTGLRIGEICGLKFSDIDFNSHTLSVRRTVQRIIVNDINSKTDIYIGPPKSQSSIRDIPIPVFLINYLSEFKTYDDAYILSGIGTPIEPRTLQNRFKTILIKNNLSNVTFHSLRHMFATNCIKIGFDVKTLSEILGHASVEVTLNRYVHSSIERKEAYMNLLQLSC